MDSKLGMCYYIVKYKVINKILWVAYPNLSDKILILILSILYIAYLLVFKSLLVFLWLSVLHFYYVG